MPRNRITQVDVSTLYRALADSQAEKDVENAWRAIFYKYFITNNPDPDTHPEMHSNLNVDGLIIENRMVFALRLLLEFKNGTNLQNSYDRARITIQCIYYMKQFEHNGLELPNVIVGADENQAFVLYAPNFYHYLNDDYIDWSIAPSLAYKRNADLMNKLINDHNLSVFVYDLTTGKNNIKQRTDTILDLFSEIQSLSNRDETSGDLFKVNVTESNLAVLFDEFVRITFKRIGVVSPIDSVNIFQQLLLGRNTEKYYQIPNRPNKLHLPGDKLVDINGADMNAFFKHFNRNLSIKDSDYLISISDRLIEDLTRRKKGDYWTPTIWANKAVETLDNSLNNKWKTITQGLITDWKENCTVWDCASGAKNLTRDFTFNHLFSSTIHNSELELSSQYNKFPETNKAFQYDFLNDDVDVLSVLNEQNIAEMSSSEQKEFSKQLKMPYSLFSRLVNNEPFVFYINPPYGTANERQFSSNNGSKKRGMANTAINGVLKEDGMGKASQQLYIQFLYRICELIKQFHLTNVVLGAFTPYQFRVGGDYFDNFLDNFNATFKSIDGLLFNADEFADVKKGWAITFSIYSNDHELPKKNELCVMSTKKSGKITPLFEKQIRRVRAQNSISNWIKSPLKYEKLTPLSSDEFTAVTSSINTTSTTKGVYYKEAIGYMYFIGNDIEHSDTATSIFSTYFASAHGITITRNNLIRAVIGFSIRRSTPFRWYNGKDAFYIDETISNRLLTDKKYIGSALIMALTQYRSSYQSSISEEVIAGNTPQITNSWFFIPTTIMQQLYSNSENTNDIYSEYQRVVNSPDTPIVEKLENLGVKYSINDRTVSISFSKNTSLSDYARHMLQLLIELFNHTWSYRLIANDKYPEWSVLRWDAGFNQLYRIAKSVSADTQWLEKYQNTYTKLSSEILSRSIDEGILLNDSFI